MGRVRNRRGCDDARTACRRVRAADGREAEAGRGAVGQHPGGRVAATDAVAGGRDRAAGGEPESEPGLGPDVGAGAGLDPEAPWLLASSSRRRRGKTWPRPTTGTRPTDPGAV